MAVDLQKKEHSKLTEKPIHVDMIAKTLQKLEEQTKVFPEFYARLDKVEANQKGMMELLVEITVLLKSRTSVLNELDQKELEVMNSLLSKMEK